MPDRPCCEPVQLYFACPWDASGIPGVPGVPYSCRNNCDGGSWCLPLSSTSLCLASLSWHLRRRLCSYLACCRTLHICLSPFNENWAEGLGTSRCLFRGVRGFPAECQALSYAASLKIKALNFCSENRGLAVCDTSQARRL